MAANLKEVRERITSVQSTQQITKAMKMVSAAKLRKAQEAIVQLRPFANKLNDMMANIVGSGSDAEALPPFIRKRDEIKRVMMIIVTSNRGLCGAFNANIIKEAVNQIEGKYAAQRKARRIGIVCIGKRGYDYFSRDYTDLRVVDDYVDAFSDLSYESISDLADSAMERFVIGAFDVIEIVYGRFKNAGVQYPKLVQYLPLEPPALEEGEKSKYRVDYIFEPNEDLLLEELVPTILRVHFLKCLLDTHASEHGARMTAMDKATENAQDLLKDLRITYNKARQEAITRELSEIVGGAAALSG